jgi:hypothetical protein
MDGGEWLASRPGRFTSGEPPGTHCKNKRLFKICDALNHVVSRCLLMRLRWRDVVGQCCGRYQRKQRRACSRRWLVAEQLSSLIAVSCLCLVTDCSNAYMGTRLREVEVTKSE